MCCSYTNTLISQAQPFTAFYLITQGPSWFDNVSKDGGTNGKWTKSASLHSLLKEIRVQGTACLMQLCPAVRSCKELSSTSSTAMRTDHFFNGPG